MYACRKDTYSQQKKHTSKHVLSPLDCRAESVVELRLAVGWAPVRRMNFRINDGSCTSYEAAQAYRNYSGLPTRILPGEEIYGRGLRAAPPAVYTALRACTWRRLSPPASSCGRR